MEMYYVPMQVMDSDIICNHPFYNLPPLVEMNSKSVLISGNQNCSLAQVIACNAKSLFFYFSLCIET